LFKAKSEEKRKKLKITHIPQNQPEQFSSFIICVGKHFFPAYTLKGKNILLKHIY